MSDDFWAGYVSGAVGILVGNPLDVAKVQLQAGNSFAVASNFQNAAKLAKGTAAPVLGYGALNALLFVSYNRSDAALNKAFGTDKSLCATWLAGAIGGLATWAVSAPTELVKCRAQMAVSSSSSLSIARQIWGAEGIRGFYVGGIVTALRDSVGYGFYFWSYELASSYWPDQAQSRTAPLAQDAIKVLLCGGIAGVVTWASVFPLDTIKTRVQTQLLTSNPESSALLAQASHDRRLAPRSGSLEIAKTMFREGGMRNFFRGLTVCSVRAFVVNAAQWTVYEWMMHKLGHVHGEGKGNIDTLA